MAIPLIVKGGAVALLLWELLKGEPKAEAPKAPAPIVPPPQGVPDAPPPAPAVEVPCAAPTLAKRWTLCDNGMSAVDGTTSQGTYDALYHPVTKHLIAVVDNSTYRTTGDGTDGRDVEQSAWVAAVAKYVNRKSQMPTSAGDVDGLPIGIEVAPTRIGEVPFFPLVYKGV